MIESGENMSTVMVLVMEWNYALPENRKWRENVSCDGAANKKELRTAWESKVAGNMSGVMVLLMKWKYALAESRKEREHVSRGDGAAHEIEIRTFW